jgi:hypothetical protein
VYKLDQERLTGKDYVCETNSEDFQIILTKSFDIRESIPFKVQVSVSCKDLNFKERIINLIKEKHIDLEIYKSYAHPIQFAVRKFLI